jgi:hypothetical protein
MITYPQHPVHYIFGMPSHAPLAIKAWMQESFELKARFFLWYIAFFAYVGYMSNGVHGASGLVGIIIMSVFMLSLPSALFDPSDAKILSSLSNAFFNGMLTFHGFFMTYFVIYTIVSITAVSMGFWTVATSNALLSLCAALMIGFSMQQVVATNRKVPWGSVPLISIATGYAVFSALMSYV